MTRTRTILVTVAAAILALGAGLGLRQVLDARAPSNVGAELGAPFSLTDQNGATITQAAFEGRPSLLFFGFTHCPEVCPTTVYDMETWYRDLGITNAQLAAYFVTIDPERDTPEFLKDYLEPQSEHVLGITGDPDAVHAMAKSWRVYWQKRPLEGDDYTMDHFASVFVLDAEGKVADLISYQEDPKEAVAKIRKVLGMS